MFFMASGVQFQIFSKMFIYQVFDGRELRLNLIFLSRAKTCNFITARLAKITYCFSFKTFISDVIQTVRSDRSSESKLENGCES